MTTGMKLEEQVADSARAWKVASESSDASAREIAERRLADFLERWVAELLTTDAEWTQHGRWFDGLIFEELRAEEDDRFSSSGYIWSIDQVKWPFRASIQLSADGMAAFDIRFGARRRNPPRAEADWAFQFVRAG
ncbi:hypothetical protein [Pyxidicoccus xibeiensis]|uniref:hypothetical protein n=1 Tax=Pyxidicoccus xibeiensis TaxID=2906759 RepID=UPI0020A79482|nr:hypothetical protein [Pyxidicoccus xibeiensis]MCP3142161.1 hypothetical protein [Pyxidicoccus xibeiensis]